MASYQVRHQPVNLIIMPREPMTFDSYIFTFNVAQLTKAIVERCGIALGCFGRPGVDKRDNGHRRLLRPRRKRQGYRHAQ